MGDVVSANLLALGLKCSDVFNIGTGQETPVNELSRSLLEISGSKLEVKHAPNRGYEQRRSCLDYKKANDAFGWEPEVPLEEGLIETYKFFKNNAA